jgi:hypothetical protein
VGPAFLHYIPETSPAFRPLSPSCGPLRASGPHAYTDSRSSPPRSRSFPRTTLRPTPIFFIPGMMSLASTPSPGQPGAGLARLPFQAPTIAIPVLSDSLACFLPQNLCLSDPVRVFLPAVAAGHRLADRRAGVRGGMRGGVGVGQIPGAACRRQHPCLSVGWFLQPEEIGGGGGGGGGPRIACIGAGLYLTGCPRAHWLRVRPSESLAGLRQIFCLLSDQSFPLVPLIP